MPSPKAILDIDSVPAPYENHLRSALDDYTFYASMEKEAVSSKRTAGVRLLDILTVLKTDGVDVDGVRVQTSATTTRRISKEKLLERGVALDIILYAMEETVSSPFIKINTRKAEG